MVNPNNEQFSEFQSLLYYIFKHQGRYDSDEAAVFIDRAPDTFSRYCSNRLPIPVDKARDLIRFVLDKDPKDTELLEFFCPPGFTVIRESDQFKKKEQKNRKDKEIELSIHVGRSLEAIEKAYKDGKVERIEYKDIHKQLTRLRQRAAEIDLEIKKDSKS